MIKILGLFLALFSWNVLALVPVEGILMGEAQGEIQTDPLIRIFSDIYDHSEKGESYKVKLFLNSYQKGQALYESCGYLEAPTYTYPWQEKQARRSMAATLQYLGLDTSIKAIGAYAQKMEVSEDDFKRLSKNLVRNYCSKNVTVFSLRNIEQSLEHYYKNPQMEIIPSIASSPYATQLAKDLSEANTARSKEFDLVIQNFKAFCSWGGEVEDYRFMTPYLNNRFIMAFVIKNMMGVQDKINPKELKSETVAAHDTVQVLCTDLICRKEDQTLFKTKFPTSAGSTGLFTDLSKQYCHHFRYQDPSQKTIPEVKTWIKAQELEDPILETSQFIAIMTGVPDFFTSVDSYRSIPLLIRSSIDERWNKWATNVLSTFSKDLLYEEALKIRVLPRRDRLALSTEGFRVDFSVTLGEMDRLMEVDDKLSLEFEIKLSKNYLHSLRTRWKVLENEVDVEGKEAFKKEISQYLNIQLKEKEKLFVQKMWNDEFSRLVADELLGQVIKYRGNLFDSYKDEILKVPVKFSYGVFALGYLRYRADVAQGRLKLNL